jgi:hydroxypyruvate isomerase
MNRRDLLKTTLATGAAVAASGHGALAAPAVSRFRLKYAPHFGMFEQHAGRDLLDQLKFGADQGFTAWEDNGMPGRSVGEQERVAKEMARLGMTMGVFVAMGDFDNVTFASTKPEIRADILAKGKAVVDNLKRLAGVLEPAGLVMVLEPLNPWKDHPGLFLTKVPQAFQICRAVGSPSCKILFDMYHQQITEGNIIPNIDRAWDEIAYFQQGDNPGRKEPTTGEMNYRNIFRHIHGKGYTGVLGMEHGLSKPGVEGEKALLEAYRASDSF